MFCPQKTQNENRWNAVQFVHHDISLKKWASYATVQLRNIDEAVALSTSAIYTLKSKRKNFYF